MLQTLPTTSLLAILALIACAQADEANVPKPGQKATFSCAGLYGGTYVYEFDKIDGDDIVYKFTAPKNTHRTLVMPRWALGTSLYRKDYGEGYGRGEMATGLDAFMPLQMRQVKRGNIAVVLNRIARPNGKTKAARISRSLTAGIRVRKRVVL